MCQSVKSHHREYIYLLLIRVFFKHYLFSLNEEKTLAVLVPLTLLPKNHNLFANIEKDEKKGGKKRNDRAHRS